MTSVSLISPYTPQPAFGTGAEAGVSPAKTVAPTNTATAGNHSGSSSDQSGMGAGNGTGTGGAQIAALLEKGRTAMDLPRASLKSIVEAQSRSDPATAYLERLARQTADRQAAQAEQVSEAAAKATEAARAEAAKAAEPEFELPNPLPTAPILQKDDA